MKSLVIVLSALMLLLGSPLLAQSPDSPAARFSGEQRARSPFWNEDCSDGQVSDDGSPETAYGWTPDLVSGWYIQRFTPSSYPFQLIKVCICWVQNGGDTSLLFNLVVFDDDGENGEPGTLLARIPFTALGVPNFLPGRFYTVPVVGLVPNIKEGSVFIGGNWNPIAERGFFICADQSPTTPSQDGFERPFDDRAWQSMTVSFPNYRAMLIRPEGHGGSLSDLP